MGGLSHLSCQTGHIECGLDNWECEPMEKSVCIASDVLFLFDGNIRYLCFYLDLCLCLPLITIEEGELKLWRRSLLPCCSLRVLSSNSAAFNMSFVFWCKATCISSCLFASINWICALQMMNKGINWLNFCKWWQISKWICNEGAF